MSNPTTPAPERPEELQAPGYEIFIGILSVVSIVNLVISVLPRVDSDIQEIVRFMDVPITAIFLVDFFMRLRRSHPRRAYFIDQKGWLDLLGSLPAGFKIFRMFRVIRVVRLLRRYGARNIIRSFIRDRADNALLVVFLLVLLVLEFGSMLVLSFENDSPDANITTGGDALWWAFVSITTVGYGDKYPVTPGGRMSAVLVLAAGVGLFGVLSGYLANFFLSPAPEDKDGEPATATETATAPTTTPTETAPSPGVAAAGPAPAPTASPAPTMATTAAPGTGLDREATARQLADLEARLADLRRSLAEPALS